MPCRSKIVSQKLFDAFSFGYELAGLQHVLTYCRWPGNGLAMALHLHSLAEADVAIQSFQQAQPMWPFTAPVIGYGTCSLLLVFDWRGLQAQMTAI